ncbi:MAG: DUF2306 domain-containing protein [Planctomycetaceae bacterium]
MRRVLFEVGWWLMLFLAALVAAYAVVFLLVPEFGSAQFKQKFATIPLATWMHLSGGAAALVLGPWQFRPKLRDRRPKLHRRIGWLYALAVLIGGSAGFRMALISYGGMITHFGFGLLALLWLITLVMAIRTVKRLDFDAHRNWMIRNYSLTLAAVTLRIDLAVTGAAGIPFETAYQWISWVSWVPNLLVAELYLRMSSSTPATVPTAHVAGTIVEPQQLP